MLSPAFLGSAINSAAGAQEDMIWLQRITSTPSSQTSAQWIVDLDNDHDVNTDVIIVEPTSMANFQGRANMTQYIPEFITGNTKQILVSRDAGISNGGMNYTLSHVRFPSAVSVKRYVYNGITTALYDAAIDAPDSSSNRRLLFVSSKLGSSFNELAAASTIPYAVETNGTTVRIRTALTPTSSYDFALFVVELPPL